MARPASGWIYALIGPAFGIHGYITGSRRSRLFPKVVAAPGPVVAPPGGSPLTERGVTTKVS
jgi:hypothetical protein